MRNVILIMIAGLLAACSSNPERGPSTAAEIGAAGSAKLRGPASYPDVSAPAGRTAAGANDVAVIVAVQDYAFLPDVPGARSTAADWKGYFETGLGVPTVFTLLDQEATVDDMRDVARRAAGSTRAGGKLWWVFVGHGSPSASSDDGVMVGVDGQQTVRSLTARGIPQSELLALLNEGAQEHTVLIVDACFSGRTSEGSLTPGAQPVIPVVKPNVSKGTVILSAAKADQIAGALPGAERPAFSYLLLGALRGWGDSDGDGDVSAGEAHGFVQRSLMRVKGRLQTPELFGSRELLLAPSAGEDDPGVGAIIDAGGQPRTVSKAESTPQSPASGSAGGSTTAARTNVNRIGRLEFEMPAGWSYGQTTKNKQLFLLAHSDGSQIEVLEDDVVDTDGTDDVFFRSFVKTLGESGFQLVSQDSAYRVGPYMGRYYVHRFRSNGVVLILHSFGVARDGDIWLFNGYFMEQSAPARESEFQRFLSSLRF